MKSKLYNLEIYAYFFVWTSAIFYSWYKLFTAQNDIYGNSYELLYSWGKLRPGWRLTSRLRDVSDIEWNSWKYFIKTAWFYFFIQFSMSEIIRTTTKSFLKYWYILSSFIFIVFCMGYKQFIVICSQPIIFMIIIFCGGKKITVWVTTILLLLSNNLFKYKSFFCYYLDREDLQYEEVYLLLFAIAWIKLRCISFCIDYMDRKSKTQTENSPSIIETAVNLFSYILYAPILHIGPFILYEDFEKSLTAENQKLTLRLKRFIWDMFKFASYSLILDYAFHYIYFNAMQSDIETIRKLPTIALCGGGLWMPFEFYMKYVVSYGTTTAYCRLDNIDTPPTPRCIARVHVYSQMWRYFDVGLYKFLYKYIYKPSHKLITRQLILPKIISKLLASLLTFSFIFMWHGIIWNIFVWSILNYLGIILEQCGKAVSKSFAYEGFKKNILRSHEMETRFIAILCSPLLGLSVISNFYLFAGSKVGNIYLESYVKPSLFYAMLVGITLHCCCHVSMALQDVPSRTDVKQNEIKSPKI